MLLKSLTLNNFRNLENQQITFKDRLNVLFGDNSQGKTNVLEAIYLLSSGKSFRTRSDHELISWGEQECRLQGQAGFLEIEVRIKPVEKEFLINKQKSKLTQLIGSFIAVVFTPSDIDIVSGAPDRRRKFLDQLGSLLDKKYLFNLLQFNRIVRNRNQILWQLKNGRRGDLSIWNEHLIKTGSSIWLSRLSLVEQLNQELKILGKKLTGSSLQITYVPSLKVKDPKTITSEYENKLKSLESEEINKGVTLLGPQRDDFNIISEEVKEEKVTSKDLTIYGSRGEQRSGALALKLGEVALLKHQKNDSPILLLDEVLSELDKKHREFLLKEVRGMQTFITTTALENLILDKSGRAAYFEVVDGRVIAH